jgi:hypothetical protein
MKWCVSMNKNKRIFSCGDEDPAFLITFEVAGEQKTYTVCKLCETLEYFKKYVIEKIHINSSIIGNTPSLVDAVAGGLDN